MNVTCTHAAHIASTLVRRRKSCCKSNRNNGLFHLHKHNASNAHQITDDAISSISRVRTMLPLVHVARARCTIIGRQHSSGAFIVFSAARESRTPLVRIHGVISRSISCSGLFRTPLFRTSGSTFLTTTPRPPQ